MTDTPTPLSAEKIDKLKRELTAGFGEYWKQDRLITFALSVISMVEALQIDRNNEYERAQVWKARADDLMAQRDVCQRQLADAKAELEEFREFVPYAVGDLQKGRHADALSTLQPLMRFKKV